ncbi:MAG: hypothetical protein CM1200mP10_27280 [Candidatus Neomarinimicrobiota bacterium]|nr:MAG: hypothetical protein CM1200mP10_27280 [Candidatus Neomarinimicrobiota bacterium]
MNSRYKTIIYFILIFSTIIIAQRGGRGFNPANMPKIGVLQGIVWILQQQIQCHMYRFLL